MNRKKLAAEFAQIREALDKFDINAPGQNKNWEERLEMLKKCQNIINSDYSDQPYFVEELETLALSVGKQFTDLRGNIVKEVSHLVSDASELLGEELSGFGEKILGNENLLK